MLKSIVAVLGMIGVGLLVWRLLEKQGYGSPPDDSGANAPSRGGADATDGPEGDGP